MINAAAISESKRIICPMTKERVSAEALGIFGITAKMLIANKQVLLRLTTLGSNDGVGVGRRPVVGADGSPDRICRMIERPSSWSGLSGRSLRPAAFKTSSDIQKEETWKFVLTRMGFAGGRGRATYLR